MKRTRDAPEEDIVDELEDTGIDDAEEDEQEPEED